MKLILQHLNFIRDTAGATCSHFYEGPTVNPIQGFCISLLERLRHVTLTLSLLFEAMNRERAHEFSAGILTRALLLDTLIGMNLLLVLKKAESDGTSPEEREARILQFCNIMLADGLGQTLTYLDSAREMGLISAEQLAESYTNFTHNHTPFFNNYPEDGTRPVLKYPKADGPGKLFKNLAQHPELQNVAKLYDAYLYFSKYDHFGIMASEIIREPLGNKIRTYVNVAEAFVADLTFLHVILDVQSNGDAFIAQQSELSNRYLQEEVINRAGA